MCEDCFGDRTIERPYREIETTVTRTFYNFYRTMILDVEVEELQKIGGVDACPTCARRAEEDYQVYMGGRHCG